MVVADVQEDVKNNAKDPGSFVEAVELFWCRYLWSRVPNFFSARSCDQTLKRVICITHVNNINHFYAFEFVPCKFD